MKRKYLLTASLAAAGVIGLAIAGTAMAHGSGYGQGGMMGGPQGYGGQPMTGGMMSQQGTMPGWGGRGYGGHSSSYQGMMGQQGQGMMGQMGQGMMGQMGQGMMGQQGQGMPGLGIVNGTANIELTPERVKTILEGRLAWMGNPNIKVGEVKVKDEKTITAEIVTKDNSLVKRLEFDRNIGASPTTK